MKPGAWVETCPDGSAIRCTEINVRPAGLRALFEDLFTVHCWDIVFGPALEGAVHEIRCSDLPELRFADCYLRVDFGLGYFHICIGPHRRSRSEELRQKRPVERAAFFESRGAGCTGGRSWGLRFWNGFGEQMITVSLPNPYLDDENRLVQQPDWSRLRLYYELRRRCLGEPIPGDLCEAAEAPWPELSGGGNA